MSSAPLEVQVVYSASSRGRKRSGRVVRSRPVGGAGLLLLGLLNFAAAGGLYYWTWWVQDSEIYMTLMLNTPLRGVDANITAGLTKTGRPASSPQPPAENSVATDAPRFHGDTAVAIMGVSAYGWLTLATIAACSLAIAAGSSLGRSRSATWHWIAGLAALATLAALGWKGYQIWLEFEGSYPTRDFRIGMGGLVFAALLIGMGIVRRTRRWTGFAALAVIISATGSAAALYFGHQCGAVDAAQATPKFLGTVFGIHSAWGWLLIPISWRMSRA